VHGRIACPFFERLSEVRISCKILQKHYTNFYAKNNYIIDIIFGVIILGAIFAPVAVPGSCVAHPLRSDVYNFNTLLLDSRGVDWPRPSNLIVGTLSSLKPFVFNGLKKALPFSDNVEA
jgi:hypothetical protein